MCYLLSIDYLLLYCFINNFNNNNLRVFICMKICIIIKITNAQVLSSSVGLCIALCIIIVDILVIIYYSNDQNEER